MITDMFCLTPGTEFLDVHTDIKELSVVDKVPCLNVMNDIFFNIPPTPEQLRESLNILALVAALMMSVLAAIPFAYSHDDYHAAIDRLDNAAFQKWQTGEVLEPGTHGTGTILYKNFAMRFSLGFVCLSSGLIFAIVIYLFTVHTSFRGADGRLNGEMLNKWWKYARYVFLYCFVITLLGIIVSVNSCVIAYTHMFLFFSLQVFAVLRYPAAFETGTE